MAPAASFRAVTGTVTGTLVRASLVFLFGLLFCSPKAARAQAGSDCKAINQEVKKHLEEPDAPVPPQASACLKLLQLKEKNTRSGTLGFTKDMQKDHTDCWQLGCKDEPEIANLLTAVCDLKDAPSCGSLTSDLKLAKPDPLPKWRKGLGGALIGAGALSIILGAIHLGVPLPFLYQPSGCIDHGLDHPCTADRYPTGISMIVVGALAGVGGILSLKLP